MNTVRIAYATAPDTIGALAVTVALLALLSLLVIVTNLRRP